MRELMQIPQTYRRNAKALLIFLGDEPFSDKPVQGFTQRTTADVVARAQDFHSKLVAREQRGRENVFAQLLVDSGRQRGRFLALFYLTGRISHVLPLLVDASLYRNSTLQHQIFEINCIPSEMRYAQRGYLTKRIARRRPRRTRRIVMTSRARSLRSSLLALTVAVATSMSASAVEMTPELRKIVDGAKAEGSLRI